MEMENVEQKQLIRLGKREEYKIRPVLVKLKDEEAAKEVLVSAKRLRFSEQYAGVFISKDLSRAEREREKNLRKKLKELRENETEEECYKKWENSKRKDRKKHRGDEVETGEATEEEELGLRVKGKEEGEDGDEGKKNTQAKKLEIGKK